MENGDEITVELLLRALNFYESSPDGQYDKIAVFAIKDLLNRIFQFQPD